MAPGSPAQPFSFPSHFHWAPFFTLQPVAATRARQLGLWCELVTAYCAASRLFVLDLDEPPEALFANTELPRRLSRDAQEAVLDALAGQGGGEWLEKPRKLLVTWRSAEDWADALEEVVRDNALQGAVLTLEELSSGSEVAGTEVEGLPALVLGRALEVLERRGKAARFGGSEDDGDEGVKFT